MNEATNFLLLYHVMCFTSFVENPENRYLIGWSFIGVIGANMAVHFTLLVLETIDQCKESAKEKCCKKPLTEEEIARRKALSVIAEEDEFESNFSQ